MRFFDLPHACVLLLAAQGVLATSPSTHRMLQAATKRSDLYRRGVRIVKRFGAEVKYVEEENGWGGAVTFASQVKVESQKPVLNLEEIEHHLQDVSCADGKMKLSFVDTSSARDAYFSCHEKGGGLVITSHDSCNGEGERAVYRVHNVSFADDGESLDLSVTEARWQDAFDRFDISFGHTADDHLFRRHSDFSKIRKKRQSFNVAIPDNIPDRITNGMFDLTSQLLDTTFAAGDFLLGLEQLVPIPALPIEIGCKNCTTRGQIALTQGAIQIDFSQIDVVPDFLQGGNDGKEISNLLTGGFIERSAMGVGARLELFARPKVSGAFEIALFPLPILGFAIPGIGKAGAVFEPRIAVDFDISGGFELNYGIDVAIPNDSSIRLDLTNIAQSSVTGFPGSTLTPLPFKVNITDVDILLGLAFKPTIPVGFEFSNQLKAEALVSMNLPRLDAKLSTNAQANCGNGSNTTVPAAPYANTTTDVTGGLASLGPLALVEANISITVDVGISLNLPLLPPPFADFGVDANLFSTVFPLITACVDAGLAMPVVTGSVGGNGTVAPVNATSVLKSTVYVVSTTPPPSASKVHVSSKKTIAISTPCNSTLVAPAKSTLHVTSTKIHTATVHVNKTKPLTTANQNAKATPILSLWSNSSMPLSSVVPDSIVAPALSTPTGPLVPTVIMASGFLASSNVSALPAQQTGPAVFTGAAMLGVQVPTIQWTAVGWQVGLLGCSVFVGAMVL